MSHPVQPTQPAQAAQPAQPEPGNPLLSGFRQLLGIIVEFGMTTVVFGAGIYAFILVLHVEMVPEVKVAIALALTLAGLSAQLWMFSRLNPRVQSDEVKDALRTMTNLVERLVENRIQRNSKSDAP